MDDFEEMLYAERISLERFVRYRLSSREDADDILQEIYLAAYQTFPQLKTKLSVKSWLLTVARYKCNDYFRKKLLSWKFSQPDLSRSTS